MDPGRLRHTIHIQKPVLAPDAISGNDVIWTDHATKVRAAIMPYQGREYFQAQQVQSEATSRILIRYIADIDTSMRIVWGKRIFNIISIIDPYERHRELQLMCKEGVNDG